MVSRDQLCLHVHRVGGDVHRSLSHNMVFTQGRGFVLGISFDLQNWFAPLSRVGLPCRGHRLFGNVISFW